MKPTSALRGAHQNPDPRHSAVGRGIPPLHPDPRDPLTHVQPITLQTSSPLGHYRTPTALHPHKLRASPLPHPDRPTPTHQLLVGRHGTLTDLRPVKPARVRVGLADQPLPQRSVGEHALDPDR